MAILVISFKTPSGIVVPRLLPDGSIGARFEVVAQFESTEGACGIAEYRQYIKGRRLINGQVEKQELAPGVQLSPEIFNEDGVPYPGPAPAGMELAYGYRDFGKEPGDDPRERYDPDVATGCKCWMVDSPGWKTPFSPAPRTK